LKLAADDALTKANNAELALKAFGDKCLAEGVSAAEPVKPPIPVKAGTWVVYLQIRKNSKTQEAVATEISNELQASGKCKVEGIERLGIGPARRELRYFNKDQREAAEQILDLITVEPKPVLHYINRYEKTDPTHIPSHFEIWFEPDPANAPHSTKPASGVKASD
jgi:hypothetical protein